MWPVSEAVACGLCLRLWHVTYVCGVWPVCGCGVWPVYEAVACDLCLWRVACV